MDTTASVDTPAELPRVRLVFLHAGGAEVVPLEASRSYVVGREPPADVVVAEPSVSRRHVELRWTEQRLTVRDLGSRHGTRKNGVALADEAVTFDVGDELRLGQVRVLVHRADDDRRAALLTDTALLRRLDEELLRSRLSARTGAVLLVRGPAATLRPHLAALASYEHAAWVGDGLLLVCLPELGGAGEHAAAEARAQTWRADDVALAWTPLPCPAQSSGALYDRLWAALEPLGSAQVARLGWGRQQRQVTPARDGVSRVVAKSRALQRVLDQAQRLAASELPVLVLGPTGVGKELVAELVHAWSPRRGAPFIALSCATLTTNLVMAELFGYEGSAFTGALSSARAGILEAAHHGTVFLDEVGELSRDAQAALLRALETKRIRRVGGTQEIDADVRVVAATCAPLRERVASGAFREDLYYRLAGDVVEIPPLSERPEDVRALAETFVQQLGAGRVQHISPGAQAALLAHSWPGNVRELRQVIQRALAWATGDTLELEDLPDSVRAPTPVPRDSGPSPRAATSGTLPEQLRALRRQLIVQALAEARGHRETAARALGIPRRTLAYHIQELGLGDEPDRPR